MCRNCVLVVLSALLLSQCGGTSDSDPNLQVSGAKSAILWWERITGEETSVRLPRPSASLGMFTSMFLAQGHFLPANTAMRGVDVGSMIVAGQGQATTDETFQLLQEFGAVLQVDIMDLLNRSPNRATTLQQYIDSLKGVGTIAQRKHTELEAKLEELELERREQRTIVKDMEREIRNALNNEDYGTAGSKQQALTEAQGTLAEVETTENLTSDIRKRYENLLKIAAERLKALESNREVLIAGVKVIDVPGVEDIGVIEEEIRRGSRRSNNEDPFGTDVLN